MLWPIKNKSKLHYCRLLCINVKLLNILSQFVLCTKLIDNSLYDCHGLLHSKVATVRQEPLPDRSVSPFAFGNNPARWSSN